MEATANSLQTHYQELKEENPHLRAKQAAEKLGVTEAELTQVMPNIVPLKPEFQEILKRVTDLGYVMALTRNENVVHERKGTYLNPELENPHVGLFVGDDIDLRIFFASWKYAFAIQSEERGKASNGLLFYAKDGSSIHKIYLTKSSNYEAFDQLVSDFSLGDLYDIVPEKTPAKPAPKADSEIDVEAFQEEWRNLQDTHHFFGMLKKYGVERTQALRLAPEGDYAVKVEGTALRDILQRASEKKVEIMVFVGNPGMIQIHTGPVNNLLEHGTWYNVIDPAFNLHVNEPAITECWVVRKPTEDGVVTALECYDKDGELIVQFFGKRKPGIPELTSWREIVKETEDKLKA
tara:strand:+ start:3082 stop:4128 length:1047 start_codon:yes stop_codon:yes gene_type:complete